jgi:hypothetical protein
MPEITKSDIDPPLEGLVPHYSFTCSKRNLSILLYMLVQRLEMLSVMSPKSHEPEKVMENSGSRYSPSSPLENLKAFLD